MDREAILKKAQELAKEVDLIKDYFPKTAIIAVACDMAEWCYAHPVKEPVSEDLDAAADKYESEQQEKYKDRDNHDFDNYRDGFVDGLTYTYDAFKAGAQWQKEQLMEDSVNATIDHPFPEYEYPNLFPNYRELKDFVKRHKLKDEDEVKVIIIKDE